MSDTVIANPFAASSSAAFRCQIGVRHGGHIRSDTVLRCGGQLGVRYLLRRGFLSLLRLFGGLALRLRLGFGFLQSRGGSLFSLSLLFGEHLLRLLSLFLSLLFRLLAFLFHLLRRRLLLRRLLRRLLRLRLRIDLLGLFRLPLPARTVTFLACLLYTSPSPRDVEESRMPSSA